MNTLPSRSTAALETWCFKTLSTKIIKHWKNDETVCDRWESWCSDVWDASPVLVVVQRDVGHLVTIDPLQEVGHRLLFVTVDVVRTAQLHLLLRERESSNCSTRPRLTSDITSDTKYLKVLVSSVRFVPQRIQLILLTDQIYWTFALFHLVTVTNSDGKL